MEGSGLMVRDNVALALSGVLEESVAVMTTLFDPEAAGVPLIRPLELMFNPLGNPVAVNV
jgi:hypothetical protein